MGKRKWKAGQIEQAEPPTFLQRFRTPIIIVTVLAVAGGLFVYRFNNSRYQYGDARTEYNRALAACMKDRTQVDSARSSVDDAAEACLRDTPAPPEAK